MASSHFYFLNRWVKDGQGDFRKSSELQITVASGWECSDHATEDKIEPAVGDPVISYTTFPRSDEYATVLAGVGPELPPTASDIFSFCTRTYGGTAQVCDFLLPVTEAWLAALDAYLTYYFPALATAFASAGLTTANTRLDVLNTLAQIIQPGVAPVTAEF